MNDKRFIGIGIGASRAKVVTVSADLKERHVTVRDHYGDPKGMLCELLRDIDPGEIAGVAVTGRDGAGLRANQKVYESETIEECLRLLDIDADIVVSMGGESFVVYPIGRDGAVLDYVAGNKCAAGTVEFFKQQLGRMGLSIDQAADIARNGTVVPLAKRCSVHCKSDCTHALNKNKCSVEDIVRTLCYNMAEKVAGLVGTTGIKEGKMTIIGGATANPVIIEYIKQLLPDFTVTVPGEAEYFEALGAASIARGRSGSVPVRWKDMFKRNGSSFGFLPPLTDYADKVTFLPGKRGKILAGRKYILGIDGGSTTTKVALVDMETLEICGSHYTKTNGSPEKAMKQCMSCLGDQISRAVAGGEINIVGAGTTGSSGEILSVLCQTPWYHNEIIAHAYGASHFCPRVDTIFEIGGQDSKFTSLRARVAVDFSMNESCSAGTGSFIEETARDDLGISMEQIADLALQSQKPPRFSDQCAAFANTDTRKAFQEGASKADNLAGLIYAIVENYMNKVVGRRKIGDHILFQGGTSKNRAIAYAFAAKTGKHITVPPDSELMGCFGIALWLREKLLSGEAEEEKYSIEHIRKMSVSRTQEFVCKACENVCTIRNMTINGKTYPFGGQCSKWENARNNRKTDTDELDLVSVRNRMLFHDYGVAPHTGSNGEKPLIGMQGVFSVYSLYPLYSWFFHELGYAIKLSEQVDPLGVRKCQSSRCYPYEIAHGTFQDLLNRGVKNIFVPHVVGMPRNGESKHSLSCPIAQAVPYYISSAFGDEGITILAPVIDMKDGFESVENVFVKLAVSMGHGEEDAREAFRKGCRMQKLFLEAARKEGAKALARIERENKTGVVVVGRPYNAFAKVANMGVPRKFASSGITVIPCDFLPHEDEFCDKTMYWSYGQLILKSLRIVERHPNLFPVYISNFGCGPDSFIQHFAVRILGEKPYLYLELDSHTADAGIATRVAAFLDIISTYRAAGNSNAVSSRFVPAELVTKKSGGSYVRTSSGELVPLTDRRVTLVFPSMGRYNTEAMAAASRRFGFHGVALPPADDRILSIGKEFTSGKECSPAILTVGSLMNYWRETFRKERDDEILMFFMPTSNGPCRFGQYNVYMKMLIKMLKMEDVVIFSLSSEDGYGGLGQPYLMLSWTAVVISCVMSDIKAILNVVAEEKEHALNVLENEWQRMLGGFSRGYIATWRALRAAAANLSSIKIKGNPGDVPKVLLAGEIFVRNDELSCQGIHDRYAAEGMMLKRADIMEWVYYTNWQHLNTLAGCDGFPADFIGMRFFLKKLKKALWDRDANSREFVATRIKLVIEQSIEKAVRRILRKSGLLTTRQHNIDNIVRRGACFINPALVGEAVLSVGAAGEIMKDSSQTDYCGIIFIGPFNCMPAGVAESVIKPYARKKGMPYLTFETDGGPLPPNLQSQMEVHMLRAKRHAAEKAGSSSLCIGSHVGRAGRI